MRPRHPALTGALIGLLALPAVALVGCGDEPQATRSRGTGRSKGAAKPAPKPGATGQPAGELDTAKLPAKLRDVDWSASPDLSTSMRETRDPFAPYVEDLLVRTEEQADGEAPVTRIKSIVNDTPVESMQLIAIITGGAVHKAMVTDQSGKGHVVRPGDIVGKDPPMRVVRVTRNEVLFRALEVQPDEEKPREVQKVLLSQEELQELLP